MDLLLATKKAQLGRMPYPFRKKVFKCIDMIRILLYRLIDRSNNEIQVQFTATHSKPGRASSTTARGLWRLIKDNTGATHCGELKETTDGRHV